MPSAVMTLGDAVICVVVSSATPGIKSTVVLLVMVEAFSVPVIVAVPAVVEEVSVAVYVPLLLSVTLPIEPVVVASVIVAPPVVRLFPFASFN